MTATMYEGIEIGNRKPFYDNVNIWRGIIKGANLDGASNVIDLHAGTSPQVIVAASREGIRDGYMSVTEDPVVFTKLGEHARIIDRRIKRPVFINSHLGAVKADATELVTANHVIDDLIMKRAARKTEYKGAIYGEVEAQERLWDSVLGDDKVRAEYSGSVIQDFGNVFDSMDSETLIAISDYPSVYEIKNAEATAKRRGFAEEVFGKLRESLVQRGNVRDELVQEVFKNLNGKLKSGIYKPEHWLVVEKR